MYRDRAKPLTSLLAETFHKVPCSATENGAVSGGGELRRYSKRSELHGELCEKVTQEGQLFTRPLLEDAVIYTVSTSKEPRGTRRVGGKAFGIARTNRGQSGRAAPVIKHTHGTCQHAACTHDARRHDDRYTLVASQGSTLVS